MHAHDSAIDIDSWRHSVPSRLDREDPFANDGFGERPATRLTFREHGDEEPEEERPASRFSIFRFKLFTPNPHQRRQQSSRAGYESGDEETICPQRPSTALSVRNKLKTTTTKTKKKKRGFLSALFKRGKKRSREEYEDEGYNDDDEHEKRSTLTQTERSSLVMEPMLSKPLHLNFLFIGCPSSGQTSLLYRIRYGYFPDDTSGAPDFATVQLLAPINWDAIFLCFDVSDAASLQAIASWWKFTAETLFARSKPAPPTLYLVGTKKDLRRRNAASSSARRFSLGYYYQQLPPSASACVSSAQAGWQARYLQAGRYFECSALTGEGVELLVEETAAAATRAVLERECALYIGVKKMALGGDGD